MNKKRDPFPGAFFEGGIDAGKLARDFGEPPFSVFDARKRRWQQRKRLWKKLGIKGQLGRQEGKRKGVTYDGLHAFGTDVREQYKVRQRQGRTFGIDLDKNLNYRGSSRVKNGKIDVDKDTGTSVFDPVLTELSYQWFCPPGGKILDPFAGGSTRGIVAGVLGYQYTGIEVRPKQVEANESQWGCVLAFGYANTPDNCRWVTGDSYRIKKLLDPGYAADFLFTCPPYYDLEVYSSDTADGSTHKTYEAFLDWYFEIFKRASRFIKPNSFAGIVVGEIRDPKTGFFRNFVGDTITIMEDIGWKYYNEIILLTPAGSAPLRAAKQFKHSRKICKVHQNLLIFHNGDPKAGMDKLLGKPKRERPRL